RRRHTRLVSDWSSDVCASKAAGPIVFAAGLWARFRESNVSSSRGTNIAGRSGRSRSHISRTELPDLHAIIQAYSNSLRPRPVFRLFSSDVPITRLQAWQAAPGFRGSSRASTPTGFASAPSRAVAARSDSRTD